VFKRSNLESRVMFDETMHAERMDGEWAQRETTDSEFRLAAAKKSFYDEPQDAQPIKALTLFRLVWQHVSEGVDCNVLIIQTN
jgi:hypothetical protein